MILPFMILSSAIGTSFQLFSVSVFQHFVSMRILITGGAGYIGAVLTPALLADGHEVTVLDNLYFNQNSLLDCCAHESFQIVRGDCRDQAVMKPLVAKADLIIPLAALVGVPLCST